MIPENIIEICVAIDIAILGIAYPIIIDKISNIGDKYSSEYIPVLFNNEFPQKALRLKIRKRVFSIPMLEVDEILGNSKTGEMPASQQYGSGHSSNSTVEIKNDTGCELTVRYSGPDVKMVTISAGNSQTVYLSSGSYKVAASACGSNYGGTEDLHGKYGSSFYITHSRY